MWIACSFENCKKKKKNFKIDSVIFLLKILENQIILKIFKQPESTFVLEILLKNSNNPESNLVLRFLKLFKQRELDVPQFWKFSNNQNQHFDIC
jgi:hypothetical protein